MKPEKFAWLFIFLLVLAQPTCGIETVVETTHTASASSSTTSSTILLSLTDNPTALAARLDKLRQDRLNCLIIGGINAVTFDSCFGNGYYKLCNAFLNQFTIIEAAMQDSLGKSVRSACEYDQEPCNQFVLDAMGLLTESRNTFPDIDAGFERLSQTSGVNVQILDIARSRFKKNYGVFLQARSIIASYLFDAFHDIENYIDHAEVKTDFDYHYFDPRIALDRIGVIDLETFDFDEPSEEDTEAGQIKGPTLAVTELEEDQSLNNDFNGPPGTIADLRTASFARTKATRSPKLSAIGTVISAPATVATRKPKLSAIGSAISTAQLKSALQQIENQVDEVTYPLLQKERPVSHKDKKSNFSRELLKEIDARQIINYYVANGLVDPKRIDLAQMPSQVLSDIQTKKLVIDPKKAG